MKMEFHVVNRDGGTCFEYSDGLGNPILLNALEAETFFDYAPGSLRLFRGCESLGTAPIWKADTRNPVTYFNIEPLMSAFRRASSDGTRVDRLDELCPSDFQEGDRLVLEFKESGSKEITVIALDHQKLFRTTDREGHVFFFREIVCRPDYEYGALTVSRGDDSVFRGSVQQMSGGDFVFEEALPDPSAVRRRLDKVCVDSFQEGDTVILSSPKNTAALLTHLKEQFMRHSEAGKAGRHERGGGKWRLLDQTAPVFVFG